MLQEELIGISTNEELKVQFRKGYQQFWLSERHTCYLSCIMDYRKKVFDSFSIFIPRGKGFSAVANLLTKKKKKQVGNHLSVLERLG
jgi:hypothetical protein